MKNCVIIEFAHPGGKEYRIYVNIGLLADSEACANYFSQRVLPEVRRTLGIEALPFRGITTDAPVYPAEGT